MYEFIGQTDASKTVEIRSRVQGFLTKVAFKEGGIVNVGDLLCLIDPRPFQAELDVAKARLAQAETTLSRTKKDLDRYNELASRSAATPKELDDANDAYLDAQAELQLAHANVTTADLNLSYTTITAPMRGRIGKTLKQEGALVDAGSNSLLAELRQVDPMYAYFGVSERDVIRWRQNLASGKVRLPADGQLKVWIFMADGSRYERDGVLNFFDARINPMTGTAQLRAEFPNPTSLLPGDDDPSEPLLPGQFVRAQIAGAVEPDTISVPQRAVIQGPGGGAVYTLSPDNTVQMRKITASAWEGHGWIITSGLKAGDRVIVDGLQKLRPGMTVKPVEVEAKTQASSGDASTAPTTSGNVGSDDT
jgi:membrane fusion protein (multidrug efflux system)